MCHSSKLVIQNHALRWDNTSTCMHMQILTTYHASRMHGFMCSNNNILWYLADAGHVWCFTFKRLRMHEFWIIGQARLKTLQKITQWKMHTVMLQKHAFGTSKAFSLTFCFKKKSLNCRWFLNSDFWILWCSYTPTYAAYEMIYVKDIICIIKTRRINSSVC